MNHLRFKKIDAFATPTSAGNPAGYVRLAAGEAITATQMQRVGHELRGFVNEVGFVSQLGVNAFALTFYSATREVDFCGHATVAILYDLIKNQPELRECSRLTIRTNKGVLAVENRVATEDAVFIWSPLPVVKECSLSIPALCDALNIAPEQVRINLPVSIINAGLNTLLIPITSLEATLAMAPSLDQLTTFCLETGIDIIEVFTDEVANRANNFRTRVFAPTFGYLEDPATGSGNAALGYYLLRNDRWSKEIETLSIEQNGLPEAYNLVKLQRKEDENQVQRVLFGGGAITRLEGIYSLY